LVADQGVTELLPGLIPSCTAQQVEQSYHLGTNKHQFVGTKVFLQASVASQQAHFEVSIFEAIHSWTTTAKITRLRTPHSLPYNKTPFAEWNWRDKAQATPRKCVWDVTHCQQLNTAGWQYPLFMPLSTLQRERLRGLCLQAGRLQAACCPLSQLVAIGCLHTWWARWVGSRAQKALISDKDKGYWPDVACESAGLLQCPEPAAAAATATAAAAATAGPCYIGWRSLCYCRRCCWQHLVQG
jgi:hypothetical protein